MGLFCDRGANSDSCSLIDPTECVFHGHLYHTVKQEEQRPAQSRTYFHLLHLTSLVITWHAPWCRDKDCPAPLGWRWIFDHDDDGWFCLFGFEVSWLK
jgi:hypothetical protein